MKKIFSSIILIILLCIITIITYIKFFEKKESQSIETPKETQEEILFSGVSYKRETFSENHELEDNSDNSNYYIIIKKDLITLCTFEPDNCDTFGYMKEGQKYIINTNNEKILSAKIEISDAHNAEYGDIIKITKRYTLAEDGYSVFYLREDTEN